MALTNQPLPDGNRNQLLGGINKMSKRLQDPSYDPFALRQLKDEMSYGTAKPDRIAKVKKAYPNVSDQDISRILSLGAPTKDNFGNRVSAEEKEALLDIATRHQVEFNPDLNSEVTAKRFLAKKLNEAGKIHDPTARQNAVTRWQNMITEYRDLDGKEYPPDNFIIRDRSDPSDVYSVDGMRVTDRTGAIVKRGVYETFPTREGRRDNSEFIDKIYKRYLRQYIKPEDRARHPWTPEMAAKIDRKLTDDEPVFSRIADAIRKLFAHWGIKIKDPSGRTIITTPHYGFLTSKVSSDYYRGHVLPTLVKQSPAWAQEIQTKYGGNYNFVTDQANLLGNKSFKEAVLKLCKQIGPQIPPNYMLIMQSLQKDFWQRS
jgi:hypothetical protein